MPVRNMIDSIRDAIDVAMAEDERVLVLGEDVGVRGGVFQATKGLLEKYGEQRVIDSPLAESSIVGVAIGMALEGLHPIAEIQFADFILPAVNQIISEAAKMRYRSYNDYSAPIVIRAPFGGGVHGGLYHSQSNETIFMHCPGLKMVIPSTPYDAKGLLLSAIADPDPVMFYEHKRLYRLIKEEVPDGRYTVPIGQAKVVRPGRDLTIVSYGLMVHFALEAASALAAAGVEAEVIDLRTLVPLDQDTVLSSVRKTKRAMVVYEANRTMGPGAEVAALIAEQALFDLDAPVGRVAGLDIPAMPYNHVQEEFFLPSPDKIAKAAQELVAS
jgi:2-oxoisovalerate dehydrogenase E1 component beta subunit